MLKKMVLILIISLFVFLLVSSAPVPEKKSPNIQTQQQNPIIKLTQSMTERLIKNLHIKKIVGDPVKVGSTTILGFIIITKSETKFISAGKAPRK